MSKKRRLKKQKLKTTQKRNAGVHVSTIKPVESGSKPAANPQTVHDLLRTMFISISIIGLIVVYYFVFS